MFIELQCAAMGASSFRNLDIKYLNTFLRNKVSLV